MPVEGDETAYLREYRQSVPDSMLVISKIEQAGQLRMDGRMGESIATGGKALHIADSLNDAGLVQAAAVELADSYLSNDQPAEAEEILKSKLERYSNSRHTPRLLSLLGNAYRLQGRYEEALSTQQEAKSLIDSTRRPGVYSRISVNIGSIHESMGNQGKALEHYLTGVEYAETVGDSLLLATALNNLGVAYQNTSKHQKAKRYLDRALDIEKATGNRVGLLRATSNRAITAWRLGDYDEAVKFYDRALELHREIRKEVPPFRILYNMGQLYKDKGALDKAEEYYRRSLEYCRQAGIQQGLIYNFGGLANVAELRGDMDKASVYYNRALEVSGDIGARALQKMALNSLYLLEKGRGAYEEALAYYERFVALKDSLDAEARAQELASTEDKLNLLQQQEINRLLKEKQEQQEARIDAQNWLMIGGLLIIAVVLIFLLMVHRSKAEKQRLNRELEAQRNELEELNQVKDKILAIIAHDLRSPLSSIHGLFYLLREEELTESEMKQMASELETTFSQNINMIDNLLVWASDQMRGVAVDIKPVGINEVIMDVIDLFEFQAERKGVALDSEVEGDLQVRADYNLMKLILRNLVSNSIKFSEEGDTVRVAVGEKDGMAVIEVSDTGIGMPEEVQQGLFSMDGTSRKGTRDESGSGLGLSLCKEFVEKQEGEIQFRSREGEGTTFTVNLPKA